MLFNWIANKQLNFDQPQRKGTPKGDKIGFPEHKYLASLFVGLTNFRLKKIAEDLGPKHGIKYGVLRNWCGEKDFKDVAEFHAFEFALHLIQYIEEKYSEGKKQREDYYKGKIDEKPQDPDFSNLYRDAKFFNESVLNILLNLYSEIFESNFEQFKDGKLDSNNFIDGLVVFFEILRIISFARDDKELPNELEIISDLLIAKMAKSIISSKRVLSKLEQRFIIEALTITEKSSEAIISDRPRSKKKK